MFETQKSGNQTSFKSIVLNTRTRATRNVGHNQVSGS